LTAPAHTRESDSVVVRPAARLRGTLRLPGDKSISHRALMLAALAEGVSTIHGASDGGDVRSSAGIVAALGAVVARRAAEGSTVDYRVESPGADGLREPRATLDCGNSGTSLRLFAGILAGLPIRAVLDGDESLRRRPVARIIEPLRSMGAVLTGRQNDTLPPVAVAGRRLLRAIDFAPSIPSAQVKSAILLAGLHAEGVTTIREDVATRDHTERMLRARGVAVDTVRDDGSPSRCVIRLTGGGRVQAIDDRVPADVSAAAFWLVAGAIHPDAALTLLDVGVNPTRRAIIDVLREMGADIDEQRADRLDATTASPTDEIAEPRADLTVRSSALRGVDLEAADVASAIDDIPVLCLAAAAARGITTIRGAGELRHKESDRIAGIAAGLSALGARVNVAGDDLVIHGGAALRGTTIDSLDDHRLAMTFGVAGLIASGETRISGAGSASISYPGFFADLERVRA
jgi:3-phosphoshikimate 1-carboxyvinyltransferase